MSWNAPYAFYSPAGVTMSMSPVVQSNGMMLVFSAAGTGNQIPFQQLHETNALWMDFPGGNNGNGGNEVRTVTISTSPAVQSNNDMAYALFSAGIGSHVPFHPAHGPNAIWMGFPQENNGNHGRGEVRAAMMSASPIAPGNGGMAHWYTPPDAGNLQIVHHPVNGTNGLRADFLRENHGNGGRYVGTTSARPAVPSNGMAHVSVENGNQIPHHPVGRSNALRTDFSQDGNGNGGRGAGIRAATTSTSNVEDNDSEDDCEIISIVYPNNVLEDKFAHLPQVPPAIPIDSVEDDFYQMGPLIYTQVHTWQPPTQTMNIHNAVMEQRFYDNSIPANFQESHFEYALIEPKLQHPAPLPSMPKQNMSPFWLKLPRAVKIQLLKVDKKGFKIVINHPNTPSPTCAEIKGCEIYGYFETPKTPVDEKVWSKVHTFFELPLPKILDIKTPMENRTFHCIARPIDIHDRVGPFSLPKTIHIE